MPREWHWWIVTKDETGRQYLVYACPDREGEQTARQRGIELLNGLDFELKRYPTRDKNAASGYLRGKRLDETHSLRESSRRIGHDRSLNRLKKKRQGGIG